jgi:hypothetical protein
MIAPRDTDPAESTVFASGRLWQAAGLAHAWVEENAVVGVAGEVRGNVLVGNDLVGLCASREVGEEVGTRKERRNGNTVE